MFKRGFEMAKVLTYEESKLLKLFSVFYDEKYEKKLKDNNSQETSCENLDIHIMMQKMCYFLKVFLGEYVDMSFTWNTRGPYSFRMQQQLLMLDKKLKDKVKENGNKLTNDSKILVLDVRNNLQIATDDLPISKSKWMELVASLDYIHRYELPLSDGKKIKSVLIERKPYFNYDAIDKGWEIVQKCKEVYP